MTKKGGGDKRVGRVESTRGSKEIESLKGVDEISNVKGIGGVTGVKGVGNVGRAGSIGAMSFSQRERLMGIITEEASKLASKGIIPTSQRAVVEQAVKMVIDAALIDFSDDKKKK